MELTEENLKVFALKFYSNTNCADLEEYLSDLNRYKLSQKLARKIGLGKSENIRLLCNHVMCFTNNFDIEFAKRVLMFGANQIEKEVLKTVLNYLGFLNIEEMKDIRFSIITAKALKEMDK